MDPELQPTYAARIPKPTTTILIVAAAGPLFRIGACHAVDALVGELASGHTPLAEDGG